MVVELPKVKQNFANIVESLTPQPWTMLQFIIWLDLKLAEYKVSGYMVLGEFKAMSKVTGNNMVLSVLKIAPKVMG